MTFDPDLANRIRELLSAQRGIEEKRMFGGLAFLINGNMAVAANRGGGLLVRVAPEDTEQLLSREHVELMAMGGREMRGWLQVDAAAVRTKRQLQSWVSRGIGYAGSLPPK
jgi:TfoX/Sxy family transcriptional regulator of competence genes